MGGKHLFIGEWYECLTTICLYESCMGGKHMFIGQWNGCLTNISVYKRDIWVANFCIICAVLNRWCTSVTHRCFIVSWRYVYATPITCMAM